MFKPGGSSRSSAFGRQYTTVDRDSAGRAEIHLVDADFEDSFTFSAFLILTSSLKVKRDSRGGCYWDVLRGQWYDDDTKGSSSKVFAFAQKWDCPLIIGALIRQIDSTFSPNNHDPESPDGCLLVTFTMAAQADAKETCVRLISYYGYRTYADEDCGHCYYVTKDVECPCAACTSEDVDSDNNCPFTTSRSKGLILDPKSDGSDPGGIHLRSQPRDGPCQAGRRT